MTPKAGPDDDERSNLEKLDDLQAERPFSYNLAVGVIMGAILVLFGFHPFVLPIYAISYAAVRWYLWQDGRLLQRQYRARAERWAAKKADRRRRH